jgi:outer membrane protein assembly factor BamB
MPPRTRTLVAIVLVVIVGVAGATTYLLLTRPMGSAPGPGPTGPVVPAFCPTGAGADEAGNWTTYHQDNSRAGVEATGPVTGATPMWGGPVSLDGQVYAEPLVCGDAVYVATEENMVYAINATTGSILWSDALGSSVPQSDLPCGDINPTGITGTPVIDTATGILYVVAFLAQNLHHELFGLSVTNGTIESQVAVDPPGSTPANEQQRGALALANGFVYVPYGGLFGDCAQYWGFVVGAPVNGSSVLRSYQVPTTREAGIWAAGGVQVAPNGSLFVATGNGASRSTYDFGDSVIELSPTLAEVGAFAPVNWLSLNENDQDLGSLNPTLLPDGNVFMAGKEGIGYLLDGADLGGVGGQLGENDVCAGAYGGTAHVGPTVFVPCTNGLFAVATTATNLSVAWSATGFDAGSPIVTGDVVWAVNISTSDLLGFNLTTGAIAFSFPLAGSDHFISPTATPDSLLVAGGDELYAYALS